MTDVASQVPSRFDVILNGHGYIFANTEQPRATYSYTPTFLERQNVSGRYGDNEQDFFLTVGQNDFSGGEGQRHLHMTDQQSLSKYWDGSGVHILIPGQASVQTDFLTTVSLTSGVVAAAPCGVFLDGKLAWVNSASHLFTTTSGGASSDQGAHGAGSANRWGLAADSNHLYIAGSSGIRKWNASAFSDFTTSVTNAGSLAFLNNFLYSCDGATLRSYDTAGSATTQYIWKDAVGTTVTTSTTGIRCKIQPFGGSLLIFRNRGDLGRPELWDHDGVTTKMLAQLPESSVGFDIVVVNGIAYLSGSVLDTNAGGTTTSQPVVWFYLNGTLDELWRSPIVSASSSIGDGMIWPALGSFQGRLLFDDETTAQLMIYDTEQGSFSSLGSYSTSGTSQANDSKFIASDRAYSGLFFTSTTSAQIVPASDGKQATSGYLITSLVDFETSLTKLLRGVKVEWTGSTGSVDIYYQLNSLDGSWTSLQTTAVSGTEYLFPDNTTATSVALKFVINVASPYTTSPIFKRWYLRAAPVLQSYRLARYVLDLSGRTDKGLLENPVRLRDGTDSPLTGDQMRSNLATAIAATTISITDRSGTFTGKIEPGQTEIREVRPLEYEAVVAVREL